MRRASPSRSAGGRLSGRGHALTAQKFETKPARLARGEYLVNSVTDCMGCHSEHDWTAHDAPLVPDTLGSGQDMTLLKGFPGRVYAPNITPDPTGAGNWTDDQLGRAIREGVGHDGRALFPFMLIPIFDRSRMKTWLRSSCTYGRCRRFGSSARQPS